MVKKRIVLFLSSIFLIPLMGCASSSFSCKGDAQIKLNTDVRWSYLNPKRGDKAPSAGNLWGDRTKKKGPAGFLIKFKNGFSSPPHIHNITYRALSISGMVFNDDPKAEKMWMPAGSFWTQPKGEIHITAAKGDKYNYAYVEIDQGPYLVLSPKKAFDSGERPINIDASNMVWVDRFERGVKIAYLWGAVNGDHVNGTMIKIPAHFSGEVRTKASVFRGIVIKGPLLYNNKGKEITLNSGSYFGSDRDFSHKIKNNSDEDVLIYIRTKGKYKVL